jgi:RNA polymerase sigma-70 factor (ECF subfamily)
LHETPAPPVRTAQYRRAVDPDLEELERWRGGDQAAGEALFARYFERLCRFFATKCPGDVDELVQCTLLACVRGKAQFRGESSFRSYVFAVARHELYHHLRRKRRDGDRLDFSTTSVAQLVTTPATRLVRNAERRRVVEALRELPVEQQVLLELHYWEDLDIAELAAVFDSTPGAIRVRLLRARKALRDKLGPAAAATL